MSSAPTTSDTQGQQAVGGQPQHRGARGREQRQAVREAETAEHPQAESEQHRTRAVDHVEPSCRIAPKVVHEDRVLASRDARHSTSGGEPITVRCRSTLGGDPARAVQAGRRVSSPVTPTTSANSGHTSPAL
ncbi:hypothetical protein GCM10010210_08980 [Pseudonocardia hydrocarbonoxydans]|uniref:Uncharacterized protein n=1 Tax=Pseudonocardia hydrocarbonoxydans TaxID=76726 RepID=A0A4Y3WPV9_9PSEU|nr:hypothetical protein PHY01_21320 [Pseudonocardia hydrocarbonoxydans]